VSLLHTALTAILHLNLFVPSCGSLQNVWGDEAVARHVYGGNKYCAPVVVEDVQPQKQGRCCAEIAEFCENQLQVDAREEFRTHALKAVDEEWKIVANPAKQSSDAELVESSIEKKLRTIVFPKICMREMPFQDAIDMLADLSERFDCDDDVRSRGINIVMRDMPQHGARVHISMRNVTLGNMLRLLSQSAGFEFDIDGDTIVFSSIEKNCERLSTQTFPICRAAVLRMTNMRYDAPLIRGRTDGGQMAREERLLRDFFQNAGIDFQHISGAGLAFDGSGLIITQSPSNLKRITEILKRYECAKQVAIEIKFVEVQQGVLEELQFRWSMTNRHGSVATGSGSADNLRTLSQAFSAKSGSTSAGSIVFGPGDGTAGTGQKALHFTNHPPSMPNGVNVGYESIPLIDAIGVIGGTQIGAVLRALEQKAGSDLMSAPKVTVLSGKTAEIVVAQEFRYPEEYDAIQSSVGNGSSTNASTSAGVTITAGTPRNFKTRNIGVEMAVTPIVEEDGRISLQLSPSVTEFEGFVEYGGSSIAVSGGATVTVPSGFFQPIFSTRKIQTEVTIEDGATVVMGGLTREEVKEVCDKVPFLGDIPMLGRLFRSNGKTSQKRNLLIFVTARIVKPNEIPDFCGEIVAETDNENSQQTSKRCNGRHSRSISSCSQSSTGGSCKCAQHAATNANGMQKFLLNSKNSFCKIHNYR
jgi:general secretion pathway protein D